MNSRVSWSVDGIEPSVRERAEAAARRAGMSLNDWLNSTLGEAPRATTRPRPHARATRNAPSPRVRRPCRSATRPMSSKSTSGSIRSPGRSSRFRSLGRAARGPTVARQLNEAISRLDARLSQMSNPAAATDPSRTSSADRDGRARRRPGLSRLAADQPGLAGFRDRRDRRAPERTRWRPAAAADAAAQRAAMTQFALPPTAPSVQPPMAMHRPDAAIRHRPGRIFPRWNGICSRSPARSRRCSGPIISRSRSPPSAANSPKSATPSPKRCRAGR